MYRKRILSKKIDNCLKVSQDGLTDDFFASVPTQRGIVLFSDKNDKPIQLLCVGSVRRAVKNRLLAEADKKPTRKADIKAITEKVSYKISLCEFRANLDCCEIAMTLFGKDYRDNFAFGRMWYLRIDILQKCPGFSITHKPVVQNDGNIKTFGPFVTRKSAADYQNALEDAFGLCKRYNYLSDPEKAKSCPYLQMKLCCGICMGQTTPMQYRQRIYELLIAIENPAGTKQKLTDQMNHFAENLEFENAQRAKKQIESISVLCKNDYRWIKPIGKLSILHVDKSVKVKVKGQRKKQQGYAMFLITVAGVKDFGDFVPDNLEKIFKRVESYKEKQSLRLSAENYTHCKNLEDILRLTGFYLYRSNSPGIWLDESSVSAIELVADYVRPAD